MDLSLIKEATWFERFLLALPFLICILGCSLDYSAPAITIVFKGEKSFFTDPGLWGNLIGAGLTAALLFWSIQDSHRSKNLALLAPKISSLHERSKVLGFELENLNVISHGIANVMSSLALKAERISQDIGSMQIVLEGLKRPILLNGVEKDFLALGHMTITEFFKMLKPELSYEENLKTFDFIKDTLVKTHGTLNKWQLETQAELKGIELKVGVIS